MKRFLALLLFLAFLCGSLAAQDFRVFGWGDSEEAVLYHEGADSTRSELGNGRTMLQYRRDYLGLSSVVAYLFTDDQLVMAFIRCAGDQVQWFREDIRRSYGPMIQDPDQIWYYSGKATYITVERKDGFTLASYASLYERDLAALLRLDPTSPGD
jgi:hypothetical protein